MLLKAHKEGNPGRPVVCSIDCHITRISKHIDNQSQPHVKELKSYVKASTDFIRKINSIEKLPNNSILVTMYGPYIQIFQTRNWNCGNNNNVALTLNNFFFNCQHFLQIKGCATSIKCAPKYANIFMGIIIVLSKQCLNFTYFSMWTGTTDQLTKFKQQINEVHLSLKFDFNFSKLETKLYRKESGRQDYLHCTSEHPEFLKRSMPFAQAFRLRRICSTNN